MSFPDTEIFTRLVSRVFRIEDVTSEDPQQGILPALSRGTIRMKIPLKPTTNWLIR
jgi:hypothetical protein